MEPWTSPWCATATADACADYIEQRLAHEEHVPPEVEVVRGRRIVLEPPGRELRIDDDLVKVRRP